MSLLTMFRPSWEPLPTSWFDGVTVAVEVAWDASPFTATDSATWTDETAYVRGNPVLSCKRGRNTELADFAPGTMTVTFDNRTRRFDSSNTAGALYGKLLPMKQIRWRVAYSGTTAYLFTGLILGFPITYPGNTDSTVTVNCVDRTRLLEQAALPASAYAVEVLADSPTYYWPMQEFTGDGGLVDIVGSNDLLPNSAPLYSSTTATLGFPVGETAGCIGDGVVGYQVGRPPSVSIPEAIEFWVGSGVNTGPATGLQVQVADDDFFRAYGHTDYIQVFYSHGGNRDSVGTSAGKRITFGNIQTAAAYHVVVTVSSTTITAYVNGTAVGTDTLVAGSYSGIGAGVHLTQPRFSVVKSGGHMAAYATAPNATRIKAHYLAGLLAYGAGYGERTGGRADRILDAVGWPGGDTDLSSGETFCGDWLPDSGSALAALRELEDAEQGLLFISGRGYLTFRDRQWQMTNTRSVNAQVVFDDDGTDVKYAAVSVDGNHIDHIRNQVTVTWPGGSVSVKDATSITAYGPQSDSVNANPLPAGASFLARQLANFRLRIRKDPATRVPAIEIKPRTNMASSFAVATLEIGDRVQVIRRPSGGTGTISKFCQVQGIEHQMSADDWTIRLYLAPAPKAYTEAPYLIMGTGSASYVGLASGNLVPY